MDTAGGHEECVTTGRSQYVICVRRDANRRNNFYIPQELATNSLSNIQNVQNKMDWYFGKQWTYFCLTYLTSDTWHFLLPQCDQGSLKYYLYTLPVWGYWPALRAGLLCCNFFGQPGSVSKFPPFLWVNCGWGGWGGDIQKLADIFPHRGLIGLLSSQR